MTRPAWWVLFDWGGTLMSEDGPLDVPMALWPEVREIDGASEALAALAPLARIGIVTNASVSRRNMIEMALGRVGLRGCVERIFCYTEIGVRKESPAFWRHVVESLGVAPSTIVVVGDNLEPDVIAPRACGLHSVWFDAGGARGTQDARAPLVVHRLQDLVALVARLQQEGAQPRA